MMTDTLIGLDDFLTAYLECALWAETDGDDPLDKNHQRDDFSDEFLQQARQDCEKFFTDNAADIGLHCSSAGHDFWLTRCGHGAGFWDGDWQEDVGERLTAASKTFGCVDLYVGNDGKIYSM